MRAERRVRAVVTVLVVGVMMGWVACDDGDHPEGWMFLAPGSEELAGLWTGQAVIAGSTTGGVGSSGELGGVRFPISLDLHRNREFTLRTVGYPVSGSNTEARTCTGVYRVSARQLEFFPNAACRALPLYRYTIGRYAPDGLTLRGEAQGTGFGNRVEIDVERTRERRPW